MSLRIGTVLRSWNTDGESETLALGRQVAAELGPSETVLLLGDLGAGKTVFVRGLATGLGIDPDEIRSPTFGLVHEHSGTTADLLHLDLYRLEPHDFASIGIEDLLAREAVKAIEWAERLPAESRGRCFVFERTPDGRRIISEVASLAAIVERSE